MTSKERLYMYICRRLMSESLLPKKITDRYNDCKEGNIKAGDIIICVSGDIHDWTIGILVEKGYGFYKPWVLKELCGDRLCNVTNEFFYKIPFKIPSYLLLNEKEYNIYEKSIKAINKCNDYSIRYKDIKFKNNKCTLKLRARFSNDTLFEIEFKYNAKTTIKEIVNIINEKDIY